MPKLTNVFSLENGDAVGSLRIDAIRHDGYRYPISYVHNQLSYYASASLAHAFGGDQTYIPIGIGFIFNYTNPAAELPLITDRNITWDDINSWCNEYKGNVLKAGFSSHPTYSKSADEYKIENVITFHACSHENDSSLLIKQGPQWRKNVYIRQVMIYAGDICPDYPGVIISRAFVKDNNIPIQKPDGFELAVDWSIEFK